MKKIVFKSQKRGSVFWLKGLLVLLAVMFLFTVISKVADSFTVAKVSVSSTTARKLQYTVSAEGRVQKNREIFVLTEPELLVKTVLVSEGQRVKKGDVLAKLDLEQLDEQFQKITGEKKALELQNQATEKNRAQMEKEKKKQQKLAKKKQRQQEKLNRKKQNQQVRRAKSDYRLLKKENELALRQAEREISKAQAELEKAQKQFNEKSAEVTQDMLGTLQDAVIEKKDEYEKLKVSIQQAEKKAKEAIQDANSLTDDMSPEDATTSEDVGTDGGITAGQEADSSTDINNISIQNLEASLEKLREIERNQGKIRAPEDGVITEILVNVGQKTLDSAMITMTDDSAGLKAVCQVPKADAGWISVGDLLTLRSVNQEREGIPVTSMEMDESGEFMNVTALLPAESFSLGETVSMSMMQESANYPCTVPLSAINEDSGKYFVLLLQTEDTVLGKQEIARKVEVKVLERNNTYAALEAGSLEADSQIVIDSNRYVEPGDRVRLKEE